MRHKMKLLAEVFEDLKLNNKKREYRLYDEKRRLMKLGDEIEFSKLPNLDETILTKIVGLSIYADFYNMYEDYFESDFKDSYNSVQDVVDDTYNGYYTKEEEAKYGVIAIKIKKIN